MTFQTNQYSDHTEELELIYNKAFEVSSKLPDDYIFVETGTRAGGSALAILNAIKDSNSKRWIFTIDPYGEKPYKVGDDIATNLEYDENKYRTAMKVIADYALENKLNHAHFRMKSLDWMKMFDFAEFWHEGETLQAKFGFAYLDGDHDTDTVSKEYAWLSGHTKDVSVLVDDAHYLSAKLIKTGKKVGDKLWITTIG